MIQQLEQLKADALDALQKIKDSEALEQLEKKLLGRKGELTAILRGLVSLDDEGKKKIGKLSNEIKEELMSRFAEIRNTIEAKGGSSSFVDVSLPAAAILRGHIHPITRISREIEDMFRKMGFLVLDGPELESEQFNFNALNIPADHPARDMQDTFYVGNKGDAGEYELVMRTHTSPMQVRAMLQYGAPLRCVVPGRVFRNEATDATHDTTFNQIEGLMIGENISLANLSAVLSEVLRGIFDEEIKTRIRPGYFPFVEPGLEIDISCTICKGAKCPACKHTGWLEMLGAGMVHPNVLKAGNIDPEKYSGFAFGIGLTRLAMMRYKIDDIRLFNSGNLRFLEQF